VRNATARFQFLREMNLFGGRDIFVDLTAPPFQTA
jgi:hypothetical protein